MTNIHHTTIYVLRGTKENGIIKHIWPKCLILLHLIKNIFVPKRIIKNTVEKLPGALYAGRYI